MKIRKKFERNIPKKDQYILLTIGIIELFIFVFMIFFSKVFIRPDLTEGLFSGMNRTLNLIAYTILCIAVFIPAFYCINRLGYMKPIITSIITIVLFILTIYKEAFYSIPFIIIAIFYLISIVIEITIFVKYRKNQRLENEK